MFRLASRYVIAIVRDIVCVPDRVCSGSVSRLPGTAAAFSRGNPLSQLGNDLHHTLRAANDNLADSSRRPLPANPV